MEIYNEIDQIGTMILSEMGGSEVAGVDVQHIQNKTLPECDLSVLHSIDGHVRWKRWSAVKLPEWKREGRVQIYPQVSITGRRGENDHNWKKRCCRHGYPMVENFSITVKVTV